MKKNLKEKINNFKSKSQNDKNEESKETKLLDNAFALFTEKGFKDTSIQEIVDRANVAKGTFYLYFKDKYEIRDILIIKKSQKLFNDALKKLRKQEKMNLTDQIIFIIDCVIDALKKNQLLLKFISKDLSWGIYSKTINEIYEKNNEEENGMYQLFLKGIEENNLKIENPYVTLYMIIELVSSTCFNSILYKEPLPIEEYKPFLHDAIRKIMS